MSGGLIKEIVDERYCINVARGLIIPKYKNEPRSFLRAGFAINRYLE
jgi:hypothetical protein